MTTPNRPAEMSDLEWLVAMEEIRQLKARRDRYVDAHDWDAYQALHAPEHTSFHASLTRDEEPTAWTSSEEMVRNVKHMMTEVMPITVHHSYDPEITFDTPTSARGIWAMTGAHVSKDADGKPGWGVVYGYYYETYEKREGRWVFTTRRWHRYIATGTDGVVFPTSPVIGSRAFENSGKDFGQGPA